MTAPVDVLAVMDLYTAELTAALERLVREVASGRVSNYDRELADVDKWRTDAVNARAAVAELIAALENSDAWIREMRIQHGLQATATLDQNRAALARCSGGAK